MILPITYKRPDNTEATVTIEKLGNVDKSVYFDLSVGGTTIGTVTSQLNIKEGEMTELGFHPIDESNTFFVSEEDFKAFINTFFETIKEQK